MNFIGVLSPNNEVAALSLGFETTSLPVLDALGCEIELVLVDMVVASVVFEAGLVAAAVTEELAVVLVDVLAEETVSSESFHGARTHSVKMSLSTYCPLLTVGVRLKI